MVVIDLHAIARVILNAICWTYGFFVLCLVCAFLAESRQKAKAEREASLTPAQRKARNDKRLADDENRRANIAKVRAMQERRLNAKPVNDARPLWILTAIFGAVALALPFVLR